MQTTSAYKFIRTGEVIRFLFNPQGSKPEIIAAAIEETNAFLRSQPFKHLENYLNRLDNLQKWLEQPNNSLYNNLPGEIIAQFNDIVEHLLHNVYSEASEWQTIILNQSAVSAKLRALESRLTFDDQKALLADTIRCLECGAPRAAIVMGWNLTYEYLRRWVFVDTAGRLATFNGLLTTKKRNKTDLYEPIADYDHFQDLGERSVLDWLFEAKIIDKGSYQILVDALNRRNHFAHPSFAKASDTSSAGYIENLIINIFDDPRFAY